VGAHGVSSGLLEVRVEDEAPSTTGTALETAARSRWYGRVIVGGAWRCQRCLPATVTPAAA